jgi:hypothetical protein
MSKPMTKVLLLLSESQRTSLRRFSSVFHPPSEVGEKRKVVMLEIGSFVARG